MFERKASNRPSALAKRTLAAIMLIAGLLTSAEIWRNFDLFAIIQRQEVNVFGYLAASLVLATFCMRSMSGLRSMALASNLAFIAYGYLADLMPVLLLHIVLLPVNGYRLLQLLQIDLRPK
ncbi:hypothetical protein [Bradyrhizobium sp. NAS80.1]|uniref:hypothetical protein n=1 Tax=Bradyrhizobium sp. NAS80.1 TaxID=1680159 RepID=UPI001161013C|nr:hypothetical protein [Bradyrhizobium sp. NAS80.1]